jgi:membrane-associated protease RseP (regulator of RpoE activity)
VFAFFSGEEIGLLGSAHYTRHPAVPIDRTVAMLNFDMVGRMRNERLHVGGVESGAGLRALVTAAAGGTKVDLSLKDEPFGPSDHTSFYSAGVPVLFFHTGSHDDYHRPGDTADKINAAGMAEVARIGGYVAEQLGHSPRPAYVKLSPSARGPRASGAAGGAFLGVAVDGRTGSDGVTLGSVVADSAAARAGLRGGDVIVRLDDRPLASFEDLRQAIAGKRPGDTVTLLYLRDGEDRTASAILGTR